jgi:hypothetical protein
MIFNVLNGIFLVAYLLSALVQYNDPDPVAWVFIYTAAMWMCIEQYRKNLSLWLPILLLFICLLWIGALLPSIVGQVTWQEIFESITMKTSAVEEAREIGGLSLVALWAAIIMFYVRGPKLNNET